MKVQVYRIMHGSSPIATLCGQGKQHILILFEHGFNKRILADITSTEDYQAQTTELKELDYRAKLGDCWLESWVLTRLAEDAHDGCRVMLKDNGLDRLLKVINDQCALGELRATQTIYDHVFQPGVH